MRTVIIKRFDNSFSANITLTKLQDAGIECYLFDEHTITISPILNNVVGNIKLVVDENDAVAAQTLLQQFDEEYVRSVTCPKCGLHKIELVSKPGTKNFITSVLTWLFSSYAVAPENIYQCRNCGYESDTLPLNIAELN